MTPEKIATGAFRVVGVGGVFSHEDISGIPALWQEFARRAGEIPQADAARGAFGAQWGTPEKFDYVAGLASAGGDIPDGMSECKIPAGNCAKFALRISPEQAAQPGGMQAAFKDGFARIFREAMPASGLQTRPAPILERYGEKFDPKTMSGEVEIWIPVV